MRSSVCRDVDKLYLRLARLAEREFADVVEQVEVREDRLRLHIVDGSFIDVWFSRRIPCKYAFHWERRHIDGTVYRWDNAAHRRIEGWKPSPTTSTREASVAYALSGLGRSWRTR